MMIAFVVITCILALVGKVLAVSDRNYSDSTKKIIQP